MLAYWNSRTVLVTGGASFIGSHLVDRLVSLGAHVRVADDMSSGRIENLSQSIDKIELLEGNLLHPDFARQACSGMQQVFHLAASHGGRGYIDTHPVECSSNMVLDGTVFAAAYEAGVEHVCFASTACVYPTTLQEVPRDGHAIYLREDMANTYEPNKAFSDGEYGWAKLMGEMSLQAYSRQYGMKTACGRIFTAYGERENETHAVIAWIARAFVQQNPFVIWGTGEQDRNFTYVGDIVEGLLRAAEHISDGSPVNLGTAEHIKVRDAVEMVLDMTGVSTEIFCDLSKPTGVYSRAADLTRTRQLLQWEPQTSFKDGLARTIQWYFANHDRDYVREHLASLLTERMGQSTHVPAPVGD
jgi:nucleoside-diphosphate-sugar epimerase